MFVKPYPFDEEVLTALEASLSPERMATYIQAANGNKTEALRRYTWNTAISAAFYGPLQGMEIALRNAINQQLSAIYGSAWYDNATCPFTATSIAKISQVKMTLAKGKYPIDPPHVIAELSFGFWVSLLGPGEKGGYEMRFWRPALHKAFPHAKGMKRKDVHKPFDYLRTLRNRIAHHEPIFTRHLQADYDTIFNVTNWICPHTAQWIEHHSRVKSLLQSGAQDIHAF